MQLPIYAPIIIGHQKGEVHLRIESSTSEIMGGLADILGPVYEIIEITLQ